jgi:hypothetical protein
MNLRCIPTAGMRGVFPVRKTVDHRFAVLRWESLTKPIFVSFSPKYRDHRSSGQVVVTISVKHYDWAR